MGALVGDYSGVGILHCSVSGNITLTNSATAATCYGALIGNISTATHYLISDCTNNCTINLTLQSTNSSYKYCIGGIVGCTTDVADSVEAHFVNNTNNAAITVATPEDGSMASEFVLGGVLGYIGYVDTYIDGCKNTANISVDVASTTNNVLVGGGVGAIYRATSGKAAYIVDAKNIINYAMFAGYKHKYFSFGVEYNIMRNNRRVEGQNLYGFSMYASGYINRWLDIYARADGLMSSNDWNKANDDVAIIAGAQFKLGKYVKIAPNFRMSIPSADGASNRYYGYISCCFGL
jgi:hypothetical protein